MRKYCDIKVKRILEDGTETTETLKIWVDGLLKMSLDSIVYNLKLNKHGKWDCMIVISGDRMVGTGKSTLASTIGAYMAYRLGTSYSIKDIYFDSQELMDEAIEKPPHSIDHYDEARRGLGSTKRLKKVQEDLLDYFAECRQLGHVLILVLPDFFGLTEEMGVARSECLINVFRGEKKIDKDIYGDGEIIPLVEWDRGYFSFYNRSKKAALYDIFKNTRKKNYFAVRPNFSREFADFGILGKDYERKKLQALKDFQKNKKETAREEKLTELRDRIVNKLNKEGKSTREIAKWFELEWDYPLSHMTAHNIIKKAQKKAKS